MCGEDGLTAFRLAQLPEYGEYTVTNNNVVIQSVCMGYNHIRQVSFERVSPQIADVICPLGILRYVVPVAGDFYTKD